MKKVGVRCKVMLLAGVERAIANGKSVEGNR